MIAYAESSAVLAWLLGEPRGGDVQRALSSATHVVTSTLTRLECRRGIARRELQGRVTRHDVERALDVFARASAHWTFIDVAPEVLDRASEPFPVEPVRSLDAIHLATVLVVRPAAPAIEIIALDERVRTNAVRLGVPVLPA